MNSTRTTFCSILENDTAAVTISLGYSFITPGSRWYGISAFTIFTRLQVCHESGSLISRIDYKTLELHICLHTSGPCVEVSAAAERARSFA
jgi:hypothetical protein